LCCLQALENHQPCCCRRCCLRERLITGGRVEAGACQDSERVPTHGGVSEAAVVLVDERINTPLFVEAGIVEVD